MDLTIEGENVIIDSLTERTTLIGAAAELYSQADDATGSTELDEEGTYWCPNKSAQDHWMQENFMEFMAQWIFEGKEHTKETFELN